MMRPFFYRSDFLPRDGLIHSHSAGNTSSTLLRRHCNVAYHGEAVGNNIICVSNHLMVSGYGVPQVQHVGHADDLLYVKDIADTVPCNR
jgi:hypothetical protein